MHKLLGWPLGGFLLGFVGLFMIAPIARADDGDALMARFERMVAFNLDHPAVVSSAVIDTLCHGLESRPLGERVAAWAQWFVDQKKVEYLYGRDPGGYVTEGRLCQDFSTDCVLFMCRVTELARSTTAKEAVQFAFGTRFYGASIAKVVAENGRVNYDDPVHLEYSEDMIKSAIWGADVTADCGAALRDSIGSLRAAPDTVHYVPSDRLAYDRLESGDILWFVGDENEPGAKEKRAQGTMVHHLGIVTRDGAEVFLIHPASRPLPGVYEKTGLVKVPLKTYLAGVRRFKGVVVTRLKDF